MYYEGIYETPEIEGVYFKVKRIKPTKLFTYQTILGQVFGEESKKKVSNESLEECYDFILENLLFSRERDGQYKEVQYPGIDSCNLKEVENNPALVGVLIALFMNNVYAKVEKK